MRWLSEARGLQILVVLAVVIAGSYAYGAWRDRVREETERSFYVPVIVSPSVQAVTGQSFLFKITNISEFPVGVRLTLFKDRDGLPLDLKDFEKITPRTTVTYQYDPPAAAEQLALHETTFEVPEAVRAVFAPLSGGDQNTIRGVVAGMQLIRRQATAADAPPSLEPPIIVPLGHCRFEPRGMVPYTGAQWIWNCAPDMFHFPVAPRAYD
jgi:hypothetical protein